MTVPDDLFREAMGCFATGVTIVTTAGEDGIPYGLTVSAFTSVSLDPPMVAVCLNQRLTGLQSFLRGRQFAVNILTEDQQPLSRHYATKGTDRAPWVDGIGESKVPVMSSAMACLECEVVDSSVKGDHVVLFGRVANVRLPEPGSDAKPLLYYAGTYRKLGDTIG